MKASRSRMIPQFPLRRPLYGHWKFPIHDYNSGLDFYFSILVILHDSFLLFFYLNKYACSDFKSTSFRVKRREIGVGFLKTTLLNMLTPGTNIKQRLSTWDQYSHSNISRYASSVFSCAFNTNRSNRFQISYLIHIPNALKAPGLAEQVGRPDAIKY